MKLNKINISSFFFKKDEDFFILVPIRSALERAEEASPVPLAKCCFSTEFR